MSSAEGTVHAIESDSEHGDARPMMAYRILLAIVALAAGAAAVAFTRQPDIASFFDDSVAYLLMGQWYSPYVAADPVVIEAARREEYPPLFPWLLAITNGAFDFGIGHTVVAVCFAASAYLLGAYARAMSGSAWLAVSAAVVYVLLPGTWLNLKGILSEFPYMALTFAALAYHQLRRDKPLGAGPGVVLGVLLAAALLARSIGITLVAAVAVAEAIRWLRTRDNARLTGAAIAVALPLAAGALWFAMRPTGGEDLYRVAWTFSYVVANAWSLSAGWLTALLIYWQEWWRPAFLGVSLVGLGGAVAALVRAARGESDGLYVVFFVVLLLFWPFPTQFYRIMLPVVPLLVVFALWGVYRLLARQFDTDAASRWTAVATLFPLAMCVPPLFHIVGRSSVTVPVGPKHTLSDISEFYRAPDLRVATTLATIQLGALQDMERIRTGTPKSARVMWVMPGYVALLANRQGVPHERGPKAEPLAKQVVRTGADYIYLTNVHPHDSPLHQGNPIDDWAKLREFTDLVWARPGPAGDTHGVLLKVDRDKAAKLAGS